jgi:hypothetical protein
VAEEGRRDHDRVPAYVVSRPGTVRELTSVSKEGR